MTQNKLIDTAELRRALGTFVTGVTVVTTLDSRGLPRGLTINSFTSVSLDPPLVLICIAHDAFSYSTFLSASCFSVNILSEDQEKISNLFASKSSKKFDAINWYKNKTGSPLIKGAIASLECSIEEKKESGDHLILIGRVIDLFYDEGYPLGYYKGSYLTPKLEQEAIPKPGQSICVGAILENKSSLAFVIEKDNSLSLPSGSSIGAKNHPGSIESNLKKLKIKADLGFIFAVFENSELDALAVYYRGMVKEEESDLVNSEAIFYDFNEIPWERIKDKAVRSMIKRYVQERMFSQFGIYVGSFDEGKVEKLTSNNLSN